jgi:phage gp29-like protein
MIANDGAAIIPQGMDVEFHEVNGSRGEAVFGGLLEYVDKQISKLVVGQTMTSDDGSSLGQAKIHNEVRLDILRADGKQLASTINRDLIRPFVDLNFGPQNDYPRIELPVPDPEDVEALSSSLAQLVPLRLAGRTTGDPRQAGSVRSRRGGGCAHSTLSTVNRTQGPRCG